MTVMPISPALFNILLGVLAGAVRQEKQKAPILQGISNAITADHKGSIHRKHYRSHIQEITQIKTTKPHKLI